MICLSLFFCQLESNLKKKKRTKKKEDYSTKKKIKYLTNKKKRALTKKKFKQITSFFLFIEGITKRLSQRRDNKKTLSKKKETLTKKIKSFFFCQCLFLLSLIFIPSMNKKKIKSLFFCQCLFFLFIV